MKYLLSSLVFKRASLLLVVGWGSPIEIANEGIWALADLSKFAEKSAPNHPGKGLDPPKSSKFFPKKVAPNHPGKGLDPPPPPKRAMPKCLR